MTSNTTSNIIQMPGACNQNLKEDQAWKHHPSIATAWMATAIIMAWTEGVTMTVEKYMTMEADVDPQTIRAYWHHAVSMAYMTAMSTGLPIPAYQPGGDHDR